jgi:ABC-type Fe3+-hydroxamate transport system substrate-binding protein
VLSWNRDNWFVLSWTSPPPDNEDEHTLGDVLYNNDRWKTCTASFREVEEVCLVYRRRTETMEMREVI